MHAAAGVVGPAWWQAAAAAAAGTTSTAGAELMGNGTTTMPPPSVLRVSVASNLPFSDCVVKGPSGARLSRGQCVGIEPALLEMFVDRLNLTLEYVLLAGDSWGSPLPNGSWTGHIGRILRGEVDAAVGAVTQTHARNRVVDFLPMVLEDKRAFLAPGPEELPKATAFFRPFNVHTWILIGVCLLAVDLTDRLLTTVVKTLERTAGSDDDDDDDSRPQQQVASGEMAGNGKFVSSDRPASKNSFSPLSKVMVSTHSYHNRISGRPFPRNVILNGSFHVFVALVSWMYSAIILASLLTPQYQPVYDRMESAVSKTSQQFVTTIFDGALREYFSPNTSSRLFRRVLDEGRLTVCSGASRDCANARRDFIFVTYETGFRWKKDFWEQDGISTVLSKDKMHISGMAWPVPRKGNRWLKDKLAAFIAAAHSGGLVAHLHRHGLETAGTMNGSARRIEDRAGHNDVGKGGSTLKTLGTGEFQGAFLAYGIGLAASGVALGFELATGCRTSLGRRIPCSPRDFLKRRHKKNAI